MLLLHYQGEEHPHAYASGPYKYLASPPPTLMVARTHDQLVLGASLMAEVQVEGGQLRFDAKWRPTFDALRV